MPNLVTIGLTSSSSVSLNPPPQSTTGPDVLQRIHQVEHLVESLMASWLETGEFVHGRRAHRVRDQTGFAVTPLDDSGTLPIGESRLAMAWDISATGISFTHDTPLSCRYVAATFLRPGGSLETMVTRLKWCRFTRDQRYRSGGKFLRILDNTSLDGFELRKLLEE